MRERLSNTKRLAADALLLTVAFALSWIEFIIALPMPVPGVKIGLANLAILFALYYCGIPDALLVLAGRLLLSAILFGNASSLIFSAAGGLLSFAVMVVCKRLFGKHIICVSITGGVFHNIGQLIAASFIASVPFLYYAPYLIIGGIAAGAFNGFIVSRILKCRYFSDPHSGTDKTKTPLEKQTESDTDMTKAE